jgi:hypothetical protein
VSSAARPSIFKRFIRRLARPATGPIDGRIADVNRRVGDVGLAVEHQSAVLRQGLGEMSAAIGSQRDSVAAFGRSAVESAAYTGVELRRIEEAFQAFEETSRLNAERTQADAERILAATEEGGYRERLVDALELPLERLDGPLAHVLNHAAGHRGFAAQGDLWFNPPVVIELSPGKARLAVVNERIVEIPFSMAALGRLTPPARILDIGSAESTFPLSAAALGYAVTAVDLRPLPYSHPNLDSAAGRFEDWVPPKEPFDAAFLISTIEHVGVGAYGEAAYGQGAPGRGADREMLERIRDLLVPAGLVVLTTPYGLEDRTDELERTYDAESLQALIDGWNVLERRVVVAADDLTWLPTEKPRQGQRGVAMLVLSSASA